MSDKEKDRKKKGGMEDKDRDEAGNWNPPIDRRAFERGLKDIGRLLDAQEFESEEELEAFLNDFMVGGRIPKMPARTALDKAQDLMYEAWEASGRKRAALAHRAIRISKDCADAYVLLAEETAETWEEARALYAQGVKAGERALGAEAFEEHAGYFWGVLETRPYMRARRGLAECLWELGQWEEAVAHYTDMLRLNPNDNQGIRYILTRCLLEQGDDESLGELLDSYEDDAAAEWAYSRALYRFRQRGADSLANVCLEEALAENPFVPAYLLGEKRLPKKLPDYIGFGDDSEAVAYAAEAMDLWLETEGAIPWLAKQSAKE